MVVRKSDQFDNSDRQSATLAMLDPMNSNARINILNDIVSNLKDEQERLHLAVAEALNKFTTISSKVELRRTDPIIDELLQNLTSMTQFHQSMAYGHDLTSIYTEFSSLMQANVEISVKRKILASLCYESMTARYSGIPEAYANTFRWIFCSDEFSSSGCHSKIHLHEWLKEGSGTYWISGKAGSGKSTFMKYLTSCEVAKDALLNWAGHTPLFTAKFFFWNSGTPMQKSLHGLFQSLLFELLKQLPSLIPVVCSSRWETASRGLEPGPWDLQELKQCFTALTKQAITPAKFCFFIDGLDEYSGDHYEFLEYLNNLKDMPNIKLCLASRPWNVFEDHLGTSAELKLYLQDLTRGDIALYVRGRLQPAIARSLPEEDCLALRPLVKDILDKAQGVFLWVFLIVRSLLEGLTNGDTMKILQTRVRRFPSDLETVFKQMIQSVDEIYRQQSVGTFQLVLRSPVSISLIMYSFTIDDDPDFAINVALRPLSHSEIQKRLLDARRRLNARCKGLVEVVHNGYAHEYDEFGIKFLHRTVRDFLLLKNVQGILSAQLDQHYHVCIPLCRALLAEIKTRPGVKDLMIYAIPLVSDILSFARQVEIEAGMCDKQMLDECNTVMRKAHSVRWARCSWDDEPYSRIFLYRAIYQGPVQYVLSLLQRNPQMVKTHGGEILLWSLDPLHDSGETVGARIEISRCLLRLGVNPNMAYTAMALDRKNPWAQVFNFPSKRYPSQWSQLVTLFLSFGADPNLRYNGLSIWVHYLKNWYSRLDDNQIRLQVLERLLAHGADPNQRFEASRSATGWEIFLLDLPGPEVESTYYFEATKLLLRYGADPRLLCRRDSNRGVPVAKIIEEKFARAQVNALLSILKREYEQIEMRDRFMVMPNPPKVAFVARRAPRPSQTGG